MTNMLEYARTVLVVAAHPDDEILGCGGTLARLRAAGVEIAILLLGEGPTSKIASEISPEAIRREATVSAVAAAASLGIDDVRSAGLPDNQFDTVPFLHIARHIEAIADRVRPDVVFTHFSGDLNIDHQLVHRAVMTAFRPLPGGQSTLILGFEVLSSTEYATPGMGESFRPSVYIDITKFLEAKQKTLTAYASEMRPWPHPRSREAVEYLARLRGSQCGREAAEAFVLYRGLV
jgi:LmbE family N-acetylglucosaminyl deacetylase